MKFDKAYLKHLLPIAIFFIITSIYFAPLYSGKVLVQSDNLQMKGTGKEIAEYRAKGEVIRWNPREFAGVPLQSGSSYNPFAYVNKIFFYGIIPKPMAMVLALFVGFYLLLQVFGVSRWLSAIGSFAYAFSTFNIISIEVGHDNKVIAMALMAPVLAGIIAAYKGKFMKGFIYAFIGSGFQLYFGHIQITYYLLIMALAYAVYVVFEYSKSGEWGQFFKASGVLLLSATLAFGSNFMKLYSMLEYKDYSTRGGSELTTTDGEKSSSDGLDKDYALSWSYGKMETFTLIFPYFHGGASSESLSKSSETYETLSSNGVDRRTTQNVTENVPLYWGDQPFTGGTIYFGAILCFLFILSFFVLDNNLKWWGLSLFILSVLLAMGKNLEWFTDIFFYHVPLYNKFRTVTMIFSITQLIVPFMGILTLDQILKQEQSVDTRRLMQVVLGVIGIGLFFLMFKGAFFDFKGARDQAYGFPDWLMDAIISDRKRLFNQDIIRSIVFIGLAGAGIWLYAKSKLKSLYLLGGVGFLILIDLWGVDKRHLDSKDFQKEKTVSAQVFKPSVADDEIMKDNTYHRVLNLTSQNPFSDGVTSYFHYSILGYSAIKMQRYQELIDRYIGKMDRSVLNMLNTKYFIVKSEQGPVVQQNPQALGNVWLIDELIEVENADQEIARLGEIDPGSTAIYDTRFSEVVDQRTSFSGVGEVSLVSYHPEKMEYSFSSEEDQFVVFSEIFYAPGWNAYIDGEPVEHLRVNYVLRGLPVPAGNHQIEFRYEPVSIALGNKLVLVSFLIFVALVGAGFYVARKNA
ncbi:YfhO family protein [Marinoscillum sp. MHG1-6]|uniref:YfhO family protein n=1 Tax=Marinoscillum sp. MHG1-6 TaxID=2959627 RepID=UPI00215743F9|nr:YfhO family protein [Marinoscillum sp. MHG1-6]